MLLATAGGTVVGAQSPGEMRVRPAEVRRTSGAPTPEVVPLMDRVGVSQTGWMDRLWWQVLDRSGSAGGRFSDAGVLRRFQPRIGRTYQLDRRSAAFDPETDGTFSNDGERGLRVEAGSISRPELLLAASVRHREPLGRHGTFAVRADVEQSPEAERTLVSAALGRSHRMRSLAVVATVPPRKGDADLSLNAVWWAPRWSAAGTVTLLDVANNYNYPSLASARSAGFDTVARVRGRQPVAWRGRLTRTWDWWHMELLGLASPRQQLDIIDVASGGTVRQRDAVHAAAATARVVLPWRLVSGVTVYGNVVEARSTRTPVDGVVAGTPWRDEGQSAVGLYASSSWPQWTADLQLERQWRRERVPLGDHRDAAWASEARVRWVPGSSAFVQARLIGEQRAVRARGVPVPARGALDVHLLRGALEVGTQRARREIAIGMRWDTDRRHPFERWLRNPAGFQARATFTW
ncbi:MAG: hypothetical protein MUE41_13450 [Gemmatimonadaceae bacterium]|nr:hypothetical protein [Gemmatimonadaceae bacterium]